MKRFNLPLALDSFLAATCAFLLFFTAVRYYTKSAAWGLLFGISAFFIFGALAFVYIKKSQKTRLTLSRDERQVELLKLHLCLISESQLRATLIPLTDGGEVCGKKVESKDISYSFIFRMQPLSSDDIAGVIRQKSKKRKVIFCNGISEEARRLAENFGIEYLTGDRIYIRLKEMGILPEKYVFEGEKKKNFFERVKIRFNRKLSAPLFWSGLCLTAFSYFTFYPLYYIISGGILLILAAICLVFGKRENKT